MERPVVQQGVKGTTGLKRHNSASLPLNIEISSGDGVPSKPVPRNRRSTNTSEKRHLLSSSASGSPRLSALSDVNPEDWVEARNDVVKLKQPQQSETASQ